MHLRAQLLTQSSRDATALHLSALQGRIRIHHACGAWTLAGQKVF
jgi:hypothetical protein